MAEPRTLAPFGRRLLAVTANEQLGAYRVLKAADAEGLQPQAGQFAMLAASYRWGAGEGERPFLPRAFSYARWREGEAHFVMEDVGPGTNRLCQLQPGEGLWLLGPLGVGFTAPLEGRRALLVGGGVGIAPLVIWRDALGHAHSSTVRGSEQRNHNPVLEGSTATQPGAVQVLLGFRDAASARGAELFADPYIVTDDGSVGRRGLVTELLTEQLDQDAQATVYACGPAPMLEAVRALCAARAVPAQLALESGMACGFGACYGCVVPMADGGYVRVCVDGPVLDAALLDRIEAHAEARA